MAYRSGEYSAKQFVVASADSDALCEDLDKYTQLLSILVVDGDLLYLIRQAPPVCMRATSNARPTEFCIEIGGRIRFSPAPDREYVIIAELVRDTYAEMRDKWHKHCSTVCA